MSESKLAIPAEFDTASKEKQVPVADNHRQVLNERLDAYRSNPRAGRPWNEVRDEILTKLRDG